jgi:hypothetical protein
MKNVDVVVAYLKVQAHYLLRGTEKNLANGHDSRSSARDSDLGPPEYEIRMLDSDVGYL